MGALLYEIITGHLPFRGDTELQVFAAAMTRPPLPLRAHLQEELPAAVEANPPQVPAKEARRSLPSMNALAEALREAAAA